MAKSKELIHVKGLEWVVAAPSEHKPPTSQRGCLVYSALAIVSHSAGSIGWRERDQHAHFRFSRRSPDCPASGLEALWVVELSVPTDVVILASLVFCSAPVASQLLGCPLKTMSPTSVSLCPLHPPCLPATLSDPAS